MGVLDVRCQYGNMDDRILDGFILRRPDPCFDLSINYGVLSVHLKRHLTTYPQNLNHPGFMFLLLLWGTMRKTSPTSLQNLRSVHWLKENRVPALFGIDNRALTKNQRKGAMLGRVLAQSEGPRISRPRHHGLIYSTIRPFNTLPVERRMHVPFYDPNQKSLVAEVSIRHPVLYKPTGQIRLHPSGRPLRIVAIDFGIKYNQIRCFIKRGVELKVIPWNYDFLADPEAYDRLFISNGPGDLAIVGETISRLSKARTSIRVRARRSPTERSLCKGLCDKPSGAGGKEYERLEGD